jgi:hypothetical protein
VSQEPNTAEEIARCHREIAEAERLLSEGHPDIQGLCLAISDWSAELRILQGLETSRREDPQGARR